MSELLEINLLQRMSNNLLVPYYDEESELIVVDRPIRSSRYQVNVDNVLIFDIAADGLVMDMTIP